MRLCVYVCFVFVSIHVWFDCVCFLHVVFVSCVVCACF